jgi:hypothetical protein
MTLNYSYTQELENLIIGTLLPVYEKYWKAHGIHNSLQNINPDLLYQIKQVKKLPALLKPKEK